MGATQWHQALAEVYPEKQKDAVRWARIVLGFHGSIILVSLIFQAWWLAIVISGFNFIGTWLGYFTLIAQHGDSRTTSRISGFVPALSVSILSSNSFTGT